MPSPDVLSLLTALIGKPMRGQQMLPGLYDPTGVHFENGRDVSTELGMILGRPGAYRLVPSLVPGQRDIQNILAGRKITPEQVRIMEQYAESRKDEVPTFRTVKEAEAYEQERHRGLEEGYRPIRDEDLLSWILMALSPGR